MLSETMRSPHRPHTEQPRNGLGEVFGMDPLIVMDLAHTSPRFGGSPCDPYHPFLQ